MGTFFQDDKGNQSAMRLMSFTSLIAAIVFTYLTFQEKVPEIQAQDVKLVYGFLLAAFAPKAIQKFAETKV